MIIKEVIVIVLGLKVFNMQLEGTPYLNMKCYSSYSLPLSTRIYSGCCHFCIFRNWPLTAKISHGHDGCKGNKHSRTR